MLRKWHLPEEIVLGVESHHTLKTRAAATPVAQIIHVADYICVQEGAGGGFETASMILHESAWDEIGISRADIPLIIESVRKHLQESPLLVA